jgi:hypothetical protein
MRQPTRAVADRVVRRPGPLRFHDPRHTFGSLAINHASIVQVQNWMGHADIKTPMRYLHHTSHAGERGSCRRHSGRPGRDRGARGVRSEFGRDPRSIRSGVHPLRIRQRAARSGRLLRRAAVGRRGSSTPSDPSTGAMGLQDASLQQVCRQVAGGGVPPRYAWRSRSRSRGVGV